jgi:protein required for attachment to host cells
MERAGPLIIVVNQRGGRILRPVRMPQGRHRLDLVDSFRTDWTEQAHEHGRPSSRRGRGGNSYASEGHEGETFQHRFAKEIADWLDRAVGPEKVVLFAPPRFMGALRGVLSQRLADMIQEREGDLGYMTQADLIHHPAIVAALDSGGLG